MQNASVLMLREDLADIPRYPLPDGYRMRLYRPGDRKAWVRVWREELKKNAGKTFDQNFGRNLPAMEKRCMFLVAPDGRDVGTITGWYRRFRGRPWGMIHWLAVMAEHRRKGLSRCMMAAAMNRLRSMGHRRVLLWTQARRIPAIRTYLRFGFRVDDPKIRKYLRQKINRASLGR